MSIQLFACVCGRFCIVRMGVVAVSAMFFGLAPLSAAIAIKPPSLVPTNATSQTHRLILVAESETRYPRRYSKRAARRAWLKFKREAGPKGREDLRQKAGQRKGWVQRLREAQRRKAERGARAKAIGERTKSRNPPKSAVRRQETLKRVHVID